MMLSKFVNWLNDKDYDPILESVFGNWTYHVPEDKKQQMYDFYMLEYLLPPGIHMWLRPLDFGGENTEKARELQNKERTTQGLPPETGPIGDMSRTVEDKFSYALYEAANKLLPELKKELLSAVMFSIAAELRHVYDTGSKPNDVINKVKEALGPKEAKMLKEYTINLKGLQNPEVAGLVSRRSVPDTAKGSDKGYTNSYKAMKRAGGTDEEWAKLAKWLFYNVEWNGSYGGKAWGGIADGWLHLNNAKAANKIITYIDHVYDLQHNTGSVFTKLKSYRKDGYGWIKDALDHKRDLVSPLEMLEHVSPSMRQLAKVGVKLKTGKTWPDFIDEWPEILKKKTDVYNQMQLSAWEKEKDYYEKRQTNTFNQTQLLAWLKEKDKYEKAYPGELFDKKKPIPITPEQYNKIHPGERFYTEKPTLVTPEQYAKKHIHATTAVDPVTGKHEPAMYSIGNVNKAYWEKVNKNKPVVPSYTGTPIEPEHPTDVDIGDKVKIIGGSSGYVGQEGVVTDKIIKNNNPYFKVEFSNKDTHDFKRHRFEVIEKKATSNDYKIGDKIIIVSGQYQGSKGIINTIHPGGLYTVEISKPSGDIDNLVYSGHAIKKDDSVATDDYKIGDKVVATQGSYKGLKGVIKTISSYNTYLISLNMHQYGQEDILFSKEGFKKDDSKDNDDYAVGDKIIITGGSLGSLLNGKQGVINKVISSGWYNISVEGHGAILLKGDEIKKDDTVPTNKYKVGDKIVVTGGGMFVGDQGVITKVLDNELYYIDIKGSGSGSGPTLLKGSEIKKDDSKIPNFKVGDIVDIISGNYFKGKTGKITYATDEKYSVQIQGSGIEKEYDGKDLELASPSTFISYFKVGDKVKIKSREYKGLVGEILQKSHSGNSYYVKFVDNYGTVIEQGFTSDELELLLHHVFKAFDKVKIVSGYLKGKIGDVVFKFPPGSNVPSSGIYKVQVLDPINNTYSEYEFTGDMLEPTTQTSYPPVLKSQNNKIKQMLKASYDLMKPFLFANDLKIARAMVSIMNSFAWEHTTTTPEINDVLKVVKEIWTHYNTAQLDTLKHIYEKEKAISDYYQKVSIDLTYPINQVQAHNLLLQHFNSAPKPFLDQKTVIQTEDLIEKGQKIQAIKLLRTALGWSLKAAKSYSEYIMLELIMNGVPIQGVSS